MRTSRFKDWLFETLSRHPRVAQVEWYPVPEDGSGLQDIKVTFDTGLTYHLRIVGTAPPGGDDVSRPERIVTAHDVTDTGGGHDGATPQPAA